MGTPFPSRSKCSTWNITRKGEGHKRKAGKAQEERICPRITRMSTSQEIILGLFDSCPFVRFVGDRFLRRHRFPPDPLCGSGWDSADLSTESVLRLSNIIHFRPSEKSDKSFKPRRTSVRQWAM